MPLQRPAPLAQVDADRAGDAARADPEMAVEARSSVATTALTRCGLAVSGSITPPNWSPRQAKTLPSRSSMVTDPRARVSTASETRREAGCSSTRRQARGSASRRPPPRQVRPQRRRRTKPKAAAIQPPSGPAAARRDARRAAARSRRMPCGRPPSLSVARTGTRAPVRNQRAFAHAGAVCAPDLNHSSQSPFSGALRACLVFANRKGETRETHHRSNQAVQA
jgi:hypothetical protein